MIVVWFSRVNTPTRLTARSLGYGLGFQPPWLTRCLEHPPERVTTIMAGAFLSGDPFLMAMAVHGMLHAIDGAHLNEAFLDLLAQLLHDNAETRDLLMSGDTPRFDDVKQELVNELAMRSLEITARPAGVQLVDQTNVVLDTETTAT